MDSLDRRETRIKTIAIANQKECNATVNVTANLAASLSRMGKRVLAMDADLKPNSIESVFGISSEYDLGYVLSGERSLSEVIAEGPSGIWIIPTLSSIDNISRIDELQKLRLIDEFENLEMDIDYLLIDTGFELSSNVAFFGAAAQKIMVVVLPKPSSITDAYELIRFLATRCNERQFSVLIHNARDTRESRLVYERLYGLTSRFLHISLNYIGYIPENKGAKGLGTIATHATMTSHYLPFPKGYVDIAAKIDKDKDVQIKGGIQFFLGNYFKGDKNVRV